MAGLVAGSMVVGGIAVMIDAFRRAKKAKQALLPPFLAIVGLSLLLLGALLSFVPDFFQ